MLLGTGLIVCGSVMFVGASVWSLFKPRGECCCCKGADAEESKEEINKRLTEAYNKAFRQLGIIKGDESKCFGIDDHDCYKVARFRLVGGLTAYDFAKHTEQIRQLMNVSNLEVVAKGEEMHFISYKDNKPRFDYKYAQTDKWIIPLGVDMDGNIIYWNIRKDSHMLIAGASNSGKSTLINMIIAHIQQNKNGVMWITDLKNGVELGQFKTLEAVTRYGEELTTAKEMIEDFAMEAERRYDFLKEKGYKNYWEYYDSLKGKKDELGVIYFIADEFADFMTNKKDPVIDDLIMLSRKCRAVGMVLVLATQKPTADAVPTALSANVTGRVGFRVTNNTNSRTIIDRSGCELLGDFECISILIGREVRFRTMYLERSAIDQVIEKYSTTR